MSSFEALERYIAPEHPREQATDSTYGNVWKYIGPTDTLREYKPLIGVVWADGRQVTSSEFVPNLDNSTHGTLDVSTVAAASGGGSGGTLSTGGASLDEERFSLRWTPNSLTLINHPELIGMDSANMANVYGWENEVSEVAKANYSYYPRDGDGNITSIVPTVIASGTPAYKYVYLRLRDHQNYNFFSPNWSRVDTYVGTNPPDGGSIGQKVSHEAIPGLPPWGADWEWVKTDDGFDQIAGKNRWSRTETWSGAKKVLYDVDQIFLPD
jgi:hypothetical protein